MNVFGGGNSGGGGHMNNDYDGGGYNTYGLSTSFLESLGIQGPLHNKVFIANVSTIILLHILCPPLLQQDVFWQKI